MNQKAINKTHHIGKGKNFSFNKNNSIFSFIEKKFRETPFGLAIRFEGETYTYRQVEQQINQLANYLCNKKNLKPHNKVAVYLKPNLNMIIAILAIVKRVVLTSH